VGLGRGGLRSWRRRRGSPSRRWRARKRGVAQEGAVTPAGGAGRVGGRCMRGWPRCARLRNHLHGGWGRREEYRRLPSHLGGRVMRHFLPTPLPVRRLTRSVRVPAVPGALVARAGRTHRLPSRPLAARSPAVAPAPVAPRAEEEHLPALRPAAHHVAQRLQRGLRARPASGAAPRSALPPSHRPAPLAHQGAPPGGPSRCRWWAFRLCTGTLHLGTATAPQAAPRLPQCVGLKRRATGSFSLGSAGVRSTSPGTRTWTVR
jgi:hypothetical protein